MNTNIHPLKAADRAEWLYLWQAYLKFYESKLPDEVTEATWLRLMAEDEDPHGLCAVDEEGGIVGIVHFLYHRSTWTLGDYCYLQDLYVSPQCRGAGVGKCLIKAVKIEAEKKGASQVYWLTQEFNHKARRLYDQVADVTPFIKYKSK